MSTVTGIHHVTCIAGDPQENVDFYTGSLGMRLVKKSVNQDVPDTYHLFYADGEGHPGADLTFFPWPKLPPVQKGAGLAVEVSLAVPNGDLLTPRWLSSGGSFVSDAGAQVDWQAPQEAGDYTLTLVVSDGVVRMGQELHVPVQAQATVAP